MAAKTRFRVFLPIGQTATAAIFGAVGLWQRISFLNRPAFADGQTMWDTTARFHVWPWPYRFAVASNVPAFLASALVSLSVQRMSEWTELVLWLVLVPPLWYLVGRRLDAESHASRRWWFLLAFTVASIFCAACPFFYIGYIYFGVLMWMVAAITLFSLIGRKSGTR